MGMDLGVRRLAADDVAALIALRREALEREPLAFGSAPGDDRLSAAFARSILSDHHEQAVFGGFEGATLTGMMGVMRGAKVKERHKAHV